MDKLKQKPIGLKIPQYVYDHLDQLSFDSKKTDQRESLTSLIVKAAIKQYNISEPGAEPTS